MALADWNATLPADGKRTVGDSDGFTDAPDGTRPAMPSSRSPRSAARVYQENADDAEWRFGVSAQAADGAEAMSKKRNARKSRKNHVGSSIDDFLKHEGIFEEAQAQAVKEVVAWQLDEAMKAQKISKNKMATLLGTSRTQVDRILNPKSDITLSSLQRAAAMVGRRVTIELV
jgi:antitoxin HicB